MLPCQGCYWNLGRKQRIIILIIIIIIINYYYYVEFSTGIFPAEKYPVKSHPESSDLSTFLRICADPRIEC